MIAISVHKICLFYSIERVRRTLFKSFNKSVPLEGIDKELIGIVCYIVVFNYVLS